ncbi:MAG: class I SAM-dependent methyltransferase [Desulfobacteraceae bacterium]|nr:MAG: class I SAM-dependent methyltransferase [Desulfobacteraceae bacterium]
MLFGAGRGAEEFLQYLDAGKIGARLVAIIDNDSTLWGKTLNGFDIIAPSDLVHIEFEKIVVTSISGREVIACQLDRMGYSYPDDYLLIGRFPPTYMNALRRINAEIGGFPRIEGMECLHIGPGGFLGLEALLYCFGASRVCSIDKFAFGIHYPDITPLYKSYAAVKENIGSFTETARNKKEALSRFQSLFEDRSGRIQIDSEKIAYSYPVDVCKMNEIKDRFDLVLSFGVLEHASEPEAAVSEIARVTRPGGISLHVIVTRDHRCNSKVGNRSPFSFRSYGADEWETISRKKFYQNRLLPVEWKCLFEENGFNIHRYQPEERIDIDDDLLQSFDSAFHRFTRADLGEVDCLIMAERAGAF